MRLITAALPRKNEISNRSFGCVFCISVPVFCRQVCWCPAVTRLFNSDRFRFRVTNVVSGVYCWDVLAAGASKMFRKENPYYSALYFNRKWPSSVSNWGDMCQGVGTTCP
jgi:hypothetical protein